MITYYVVKSASYGPSADKTVLYHFEAKPYGSEQISAKGMMPCFSFATRVPLAQVSTTPEEALEAHRLLLAETVQVLEKKLAEAKSKLAALPMHYSELETQDAVER